MALEDDESSLLNYQEPQSQLRRKIKFQKPVQITSFLLLSVFQAQKVNRWAHQLKNFSLKHPSVLIYILFGGKQRRRSWSFCHFFKCCVCGQKYMDFLLSIIFLCVLPFCLILTTTIISGTPVAVLESVSTGTLTIQFWRRKNKVFRRQRTMQDVKQKFPGVAP